MEREDGTADAGEGEEVPSVPKLPVVEMLYCGVCGLPPEYCEFGPDFEKCKPWLKKNCPDLYPQLKESTEGEKEGEKGAEKKAEGEVKKLPGGKVKKKPVLKVTIARTQRSKHKFITVVSGLENFGIKLPEASKAFGKKFACGASVIKTPDGGEEIDVQGDVADDLAEFLEEKFKISEDSVNIVDETKKKGSG